jgi:hypothetical protein
MRQLLPFIAVFLAMALVSSCQESATAPAEQIANAAPAATKRPAIEDTSLRSASYLERGFPAYDRNWSGKDMETAARAIQKLAETSPNELPRFQSARSGEVFARMVSPDNLLLYQNKSLPLESRFPDYLLYNQSLSQILKTYYSVYLKGKTTVDEFVELTGATLGIAKVQMDLAMEFWPQVSKQDADYEVRAGGMRQVQQGLTDMVLGSLMMLSDYKALDPRAQSRLLEYCLETFPTITEFLGPTTQQEVMQRIGKLAQDPQLASLSGRLNQLQSEVQAAAQRPGLDL